MKINKNFLRVCSCLCVVFILACSGDGSLQVSGSALGGSGGDQTPFPSCTISPSVSQGIFDLQVMGSDLP